MHQIRFRLGLPQALLRELTALPQAPYLELRELLRGREKGWGKEGRGIGREGRGNGRDGIGHGTGRRGATAPNFNS